MNKEEILAMSRQENKNIDLVDKEIDHRNHLVCIGSTLWL